MHTKASPTQVSTRSTSAVLLCTFAANGARVLEIFRLTCTEKFRVQVPHFAKLLPLFMHVNPVHEVPSTNRQLGHLSIAIQLVC